MPLHLLVSTQRISSIPCPLHGGTKARKKNELNFAGNVPGCDLESMQSAVSHSTGLSALSALVLHLPRSCFLPNAALLHQKDVVRQNISARFWRKSLKMSCHISKVTCFFLLLKIARMTCSNLGPFQVHNLRHLDKSSADFCTFLSRRLKDRRRLVNWTSRHRGVCPPRRLHRFMQMKSGIEIDLHP